MNGGVRHGQQGLNQRHSPPQQGYGSMSAVRIAGITYRQLDHWATKGLVRPSLAEAAGSGSRRQYSYGDLVTLRAVKRLLDAGLRLQKIQEIVDSLRSRFDADLASSNLVIDGSTVVLVTSSDDLVDVLRNGQGVLNVLPMAPVQKEVNEAIVELFPPVDVDLDEGSSDGPRTAEGRPTDNPRRPQAGSAAKAAAGGA